MIPPALMCKVNFISFCTAYNTVPITVVPGQPIVSITATVTSISLSWTSGGSEGVSYEVEWQRDTSVGCSDEDQDSTTITDGSTSYTISGLEEDSRYTITVTASNTAGSSEVSNSVTAVTEEAGETTVTASGTSLWPSLSQLHLPLPLL